MHRFAVGDAQCVRHQLFADLGVWMVDAESMRQQLYSRGCGSVRRIGCGDRGWHGGEVGNGVHVGISLGHGAASA